MRSFKIQKRGEITCHKTVGRTIERNIGRGGESDFLEGELWGGGRGWAKGSGRLDFLTASKSVT